MEQLYADAEAMRDILQKEIDDYKKTKRQVKAIKKRNKLLRRKLMAKLVNLESNHNSSSQARTSHMHDMPYMDQNDQNNKSLEESLLFEDFSSSDDSSESSSRKLEQSILSESKGSFRSLNTQ